MAGSAWSMRGSSLDESDWACAIPTRANRTENAITRIMVTSEIWLKAPGNEWPYEFLARISTRLGTAARDAQWRAFFRGDAVIRRDARGGKSAGVVTVATSSFAHEG